VIGAALIDQLNSRQVRALALQMQQALLAKDELLQTQQRQLVFKQATIDKLTHEMAVLKRLKFAARSEAFNAEQKSLLEEAIDADLEALGHELARERPAPQPPAAAKEQPKRQPLPANLPRREIRHEPDSTTCGCGCAMKRIGQDVAEKLDYVPGIFTVERHIRGKWVCATCEVLVQAPVPAHVIDKGLPTTGLLAQVLVAKYADHLPLYRQEAIFERAGMSLSRSTLAQWVGACGVELQPLVDALKAALLSRAVLHADETPVAMLKPGHGKTHRAYLWSYGTTAFDPIKGIVFDFAETRAGRHVQAFLGTDRADASSNCQWSSNNPQLWSSNFPHPSLPRRQRWKWKIERLWSRMGTALHRARGPCAAPALRLPCSTRTRRRRWLVSSSGRPFTSSVLLAATSRPSLASSGWTARRCAAAYASRPGGRTDAATPSACWIRTVSGWPVVHRRSTTRRASSGRSCVRTEALPAATSSCAARSRHCAWLPPWRR
jgi:transposase